MVTPKSGMVGAFLVVGWLLAAISGATSVAAHPRQSPTPPFVSILFGRAQWARGHSCNPPTPPPDAKTLADAWQFISAKGWIATPNVVVNRATSGACSGANIFATWNQLQSLHVSPTPWEAVSASQTYPFNMDSMTANEVQTQSCGTLPTFVSYGFNRAWGLFAYPGGKHLYDKNGTPGDGDAQTDIVHNCFAFGRVFGNGRNTRASTTASPWLISAQSPIGGPSVASGGHYALPSTIIRNSLTPGIGPDQWYVIQFYRFRSGTGSDHNCAGPEQTHFTNLPEDYCWEDFQTIIDAIPPIAVVTDPATVACVWGRLPDAGPPPTCP